MTTLFIAEVGNNHHGSLPLAKEMATAAIAGGADQVKFQVYDIDSFISPGNAYYQEFKSEALGPDDFADLKRHVEAGGCKFLATPFDRKSLLFLHELGLDTVKIASGDMNNFDLLGLVADLGKHLILSLGGASLAEIDKTVEFLKARKVDATLLHCIMSYPAPMSAQNLRFIPVLKQRYGLPVGFSDHTEGVEAPLGAIALGAEIIEKHFTTDRSLPGGDNEMSILPDDWARLCREGRSLATALGSGEHRNAEEEAFVRSLVRRSYHAARAIPAGAPIGEDDIVLLRPADSSGGILAGDRDGLLGRKPAKAIAAGAMIKEADLE